MDLLGDLGGDVVGEQQVEPEQVKGQNFFDADLMGGGPAPQLQQTVPQVPQQQLPYGQPQQPAGINLPYNQHQQLANTGGLYGQTQQTNIDVNPTQPALQQPKKVNIYLIF